MTIVQEDAHMTVKALFDAGAAKYDGNRRKIIYCFDDFYGTLLDLIPFARNDRFSFLDLGAGTGLVSALIRQRFPLTEGPSSGYFRQNAGKSQATVYRQRWSSFLCWGLFR